MATESPVRVLAGGLGGDGGGIRAPSSSSSRECEELNLLLRERSSASRLGNARGEVQLHRSESAPPTVEGSLGGLLSQLGRLELHAHAQDGDQLLDVVEAEQELRSDPAYLAYYHSHVNLNPRLPPPVKSWENWRLAQRLNLRSKLVFDDSSSSSLFSANPHPLHSSLPTHREDDDLLDEGEVSSSSLGQQHHHVIRHLPATTTTAAATFTDADGLPGFDMGLGRPKSLVDLIQEDFPRTPSPVYNLSRPSSRAANDDAGDASLDLQLLRELGSGIGSRSATPMQVPVHDVYASPSTTTLNRTPPPDASVTVGEAAESSTSSELAAALAGCVTMKSDNADVVEEEQHLEFPEQQLRVKQQHQQPQAQHHGSQAYSQQQHHQAYGNVKFGAIPPGANQQQQPGGGAAATSNMYAAAAAAAAMSYIAAGNPYYHNLHSASVYAPYYGLGGYPLNGAMLPPPLLPGYPAPPVAFESAVAAARGGVPDLHQFYKLAAAGQAPSSTTALHDALYLQYLRASEDARAAAALSADMRSYAAHSDALVDQLSGLGGLSKPQFSRTMSIPNKSVPPATSFYGSPPGLGFGVPFPNSPLASPGLPSSPVGATSRIVNDRNLRLSPSTGRAAAAYTAAGWPSAGGSDPADESRGSFLLEEFKNSKNRRFELSDIAGHVVEFSADQHGSRFIQQKLETATAEDKAMVFQEVFPQAVALMTDVFGNYVIQKFFEHGTAQQRKELAQQLPSRVLTLSLQMYGCRVIQKALEVVDVDQQTQLVSELDGHVMRCVRDQNGNHVIQKCIECVPPDRIQFIICAFYGQVLALSTHPYGCRVIQRVLEHCTDEQKQQGIMQEILRSTCSLAQDQYGNYVVQHVLEHGTQPERSEIITKLAGQIVQMSQHKFASNVIEKCLQFGGPAERQILINEMLGSTDENEALQAMMKDQFANYVVQKVLEICDDRQREILLTRIKVHLHALKKYTYGKHIVARVEKLVAAGERRSAAAAHMSPPM
ncbi:pumilio homolog 1 isoform X1 [Selaginella moellendorffii]|uniref:pumilio homolog 1 isoform X1 n=1 Tax=Selaginella moellendorffii TaxID=88036 RepID=UPI000D1C9783|nr:pumilio homolog 1 isoform X1 [Selaginella moellendorffii]|eukprot:XP_002966263.2 pumilio homolog 1 isoform X1 [Selaginella moellendorffii]